MAASIAALALPGAFGRLVSVCSRCILASSGPGAASLQSASRRFNSQSTSYPQGYVPKTSLSSPPWQEVVLPDPAEETRHHAGKTWQGPGRVALVALALGDPGRRITEGLRPA
ncbi:39S ribosomal protein L21, mitochondrial-like [Onychomys torridus]|uniref:39S ribosomal protein L21, mitochondrial-like n=1 Tax=Onychomys torridus TaxID=38674 RepID=UPI00167FD59A|nr:39S ribosomal protein L21, mitochondrial-like [Onychomys torridus]